MNKAQIRVHCQIIGEGGVISGGLARLHVMITSTVGNNTSEGVLISGLKLRVWSVFVLVRDAYQSM